MSHVDDDMADLRGRVAVITGANSGIGRETARNLARRGATVVLACRSPARARAVADEIEAQGTAGRVTVAELDLADLGSVRRCAQSLTERLGRLDLLIDNAAIMACPRARTVDGFELQIGTNHLGHFALTGLLLSRLLDTRGSRVVVVASHVHWLGSLDVDDLHFERRVYLRWLAYAQSKLANLLFAGELQRRFARAGATTIAVSAHPGWASTNLQRSVGFTRMLNPLFAQDAAGGARPILHAATHADVLGGEYYGPDGPLGLVGAPTRARFSHRAHGVELASRLWAKSVELTGVGYEALDTDSLA